MNTVEPPNLGHRDTRRNEGNRETIGIPKCGPHPHQCPGHGDMREKWRKRGRKDRNKLNVDSLKSGHPHIQDTCHIQDTPHIQDTLF